MPRTLLSGLPDATAPGTSLWLSAVRRRYGAHGNGFCLLGLCSNQPCADRSAEGSSSVEASAVAALNCIVSYPPSTA
jgi:hypothetical protein